MDTVKRDCLRTIALKESFSNELRERGLIIIIIIIIIIMIIIMMMMMMMMMIIIKDNPSIQKFFYQWGPAD